MRRRIVELVEEKLDQALRDVDASIQAQARATWSNIGPGPDCPSVSVTMKAMHSALAQGYRERGRVAKEVILSTLMPIRNQLSNRLVDEVLDVVRKRFPDKTFLALVEHTPGVYQRMRARPGKFDEGAYSLEHTLMVTSAANMSRQVLDSIHTALSELLLQEAIRNPPWWKRAPVALWKFVSGPVTRWVFSVVSAVLIAILTYVLGVK